MFVTKQAANFVTPNPDAGGNPVTGASVDGHAATTVSTSGIGLDNKTCKWDTFIAGFGALVTGVRVRFDWSRNGSIVGGIGNSWAVVAGFGVGAGESETVISESNVLGSASGSVNHSLSPSLVRFPARLFVADSLACSSGIGQSASLTLTISNLRLEVDFSDPPPVFIS
jgi:hypothetical protein